VSVMVSVMEIVLVGVMVSVTAHHTGVPGAARMTSV
jgi:hypothetical protein